MQSLRHLVSMKPVELPDFRLDSFQESVQANLYLEFFLSRCRVMITPRFAVIPTGETSKEELDELHSILAKHRDGLVRLRHYVMVNLALYTALLETNSYYLSLNQHLLICRFLPIDHVPDEYTIKLYTIAEKDLRVHYTDKIYLGRDRICLCSLRRRHFGISHLGPSLAEQLEKLKSRLVKMVPKEQSKLYRREHLADLEETIAELDRRVENLMETFPERVFTHAPDVSTLLEASSRFRDVKHVLIEIEDTLGEMERMLLAEGHPRGTRYVTKMRRDVTNTINFIMCKVNGRISNVANRVDALSWFQTSAGVGA